MADPRRLKLLGKMYGVTEEDRHNADSFIPKQPSIQLGWLRFERENEGAELPVDGKAWRLLLEGAVVSGVGWISIPLDRVASEVTVVERRWASCCRPYQRTHDPRQGDVLDERHRHLEGRAARDG